MDLSLLAFGSGWGDALARGLLVTLALAAASVVLGTALGLGGALVATSRRRTAARLVGGYEVVMRSLPELLVIFAVYYGFSFALQALLAPFGVDGFVAIDAFWAGVLAIGMVHGAYCSEVFRGAFAAVPAGPLEAAAALGLRPLPTFVTVKLPLALRFALPGLMNLVVVTLKATPLVAAVGLEDLLRVAGDAGKNTKHYLTFYLAALAVYLVLAAAIWLVEGRIERRASKFLGA
ncbi:ABC transporter permease [Ancylobacter mangrovi]|uniref:ABC transporter permease subunit n=1 Tax=Ancylobacter mangrovi TaxID=2972472 RepID=A0A9X2PJM7_9HYPH|nr:ABC transporter permease subunit [Ancylobacter mangrovi]MCS0497295.1 ABC transporter permease subunit [Ancylobacter mangrovi]MCS0505119.1 ABC transporter permease subunit [Ancylobacter mangrovi]